MKIMVNAFYDIYYTKHTNIHFNYSIFFLQHILIIPKLYCFTYQHTFNHIKVFIHIIAEINLFYY